MVLFKSLHRGAFCQFTFRWIYYSHSSKSSGKGTGKTRLFALVFKLYQKMNYAKIVSMISSYIFSTGNVPEPCMIPYPVNSLETLYQYGGIYQLNACNPCSGLNCQQIFPNSYFSYTETLCMQ